MTIDKIPHIWYSIYVKRNKNEDNSMGYFSVKRGFSKDLLDRYALRWYGKHYEELTDNEQRELIDLIEDTL